MSSVPYGSYFYGRSRYGTPGYHFAESDISGTAGVSQTPSLTFTLLGPETVAQGTSAAIQGNHIFQQSTNINGVSATNADYRRVRLGIPLAISEGSGSLVHGTQVDQAETFILVTSGHTATGNQIDQGQVSISLASASNQTGTQIDLGATSLSETSSQTAVGTQIDLGQVNPQGTSSTVSVGTQIDLGATTSINEVANVLTLNPQYQSQYIDFYVVPYGAGNAFSPYNNQTPRVDITLKPNYQIRLYQEDSSNAGHPLFLSAVPDGVHNAQNAHVSLRKDSSGNEYLQMSAASDSSLNPGGTGTKQRRTIYINNADTSGQAPTYTGNAYPYVYPTTTVTKDPQVTATIGSIVVGGLNILTINGLPAYQAVADTSTGTASATGATFKALSANGTPHTTAPVSAFVFDSLYWVGATYVGTPGTAGAYLSVNNITATTQQLYYFCSNHPGMGGQADIGSVQPGVEATFLLVGSANVNSESGLLSSGIRRYFLEASMSSSSSILSDGGLKWTLQSATATTWTQQKIARTP